MTLSTFKCNCLTPLHFKGLSAFDLLSIQFNLNVDCSEYIGK